MSCLSPKYPGNCPRFCLRNRAQKIVEIHLKIGEISDFDDEWIQRYFDFVSKGTLAEGAKLRISRIPAQFQCNHCSFIFPLDKSTWNTQCPSCKSKDCGPHFRPRVSGRGPGSNLRGCYHIFAKVVHFSFPFPVHYGIPVDNRTP